MATGESINDDGTAAATGTPTARREVGLLGLGQMGRGIARCLDRAGLLAAAGDRDPAAFAATGLSPAVAPLGGEALAACRIVLLALPSTREIRSVATGDGGLFAAAMPGSVFVDLTTSDPDDARALAALAAAAGHAYVDAAMSGGAAGADAGRLTLMIGGDADSVARCEPVFSAIAAQRFHLGPVGSGQTMKLVHNMILHTTFLATCEGCRLAEDAGLPLDAVVAVLNAGNARSFVSERRFPDHILSGRFDARSYVATLAKDLGLAVAFADSRDRPVPFGRLTSEMLERARTAGFGGEDFSRLYQRFDVLAEAAEAERASAEALGDAPRAADAVHPS